MLLCRRAAAVRTAAAGRRLALVPTMGGLHEGHLALVRRARQLADCVAVSVYVNPLQFGAGEDYAAYPRRLQADADCLRGVADVLYAPEDAEMYPQAQVVGISLPPLADELCGASRPGFFQGVAAVVCKLLGQCRPQVVLFGRKDYQQAVLMRLMCAQLDLGVEVALHPTQRAADGLALSSRNEYLSPPQREVAPQLYAALLQAAAALRDGAEDFAALCAAGEQRLNAAGFVCDYFAIRAAADLGAPQAGEALTVLAAAQLGRARLIDNVTVRPDGELL